MDKLRKLLASACNPGLKLPHAYDTATKQSSFRLLCAYLSFILAAGSVVALHFTDVSTATWTAIGFYALCMVFYMLKRLTKASIDLDDRTVSLEDNSEDSKSKGE